MLIFIGIGWGEERDKWFSTDSDSFLLQGIQQCQDTSIAITTWGLGGEGSSGIQCVESRDIAKHSTVHRLSPTVELSKTKF